jgi:hypothetical protein
MQYSGMQFDKGDLNTQKLKEIARQKKQLN